jgi:microcystin-dependent protein
MISKKIILALGLLLPFNSFATDKLISAPTGNLILDAGSSSAVKVNKTLQVDSVKNLAGTDVLVGMVPTGAILPYAGSTAPTGWVFAYGQEVSQIGTYANLYAVLQSTYCTADHGGACGVGNFRLPDMRGRGAFGKDNMGGTAASRITAAQTIDGTVLGKAGGVQNQILETANLPTHTHTFGTIAGSISASNFEHSHSLTGSVAGGTASLGGTTVFAASGHQHIVINAGGQWGDGTTFRLVTHNYKDGGGSTAQVLVGDGAYNASTGAPNADGTVTLTSNAATNGNLAVGADNISTAKTVDITGSTGNGGFSNTAISNLPPTVIVNYIIKL